jgi:hypothetical protein
MAINPYLSIEAIKEVNKVPQTMPVLNTRPLLIQLSLRNLPMKFHTASKAPQTMLVLNTRPLLIQLSLQNLLTKSNMTIKAPQITLENTIKEKLNKPHIPILTSNYQL